MAAICLMAISAKGQQAESDDDLDGFAAKMTEGLGYYNLARQYYIGYLVPKDASKAYEWARKAADCDYPLGWNLLGIMQLIGEGTAQDDAQGFKSLRRAAELGVPEAQFLLISA